MLVKDYKGDMIPKEQARKIKGDSGTFAYYRIGVSCILMDDGKWYRTTTGKVIFDNSIKKWIFAKDFTGNSGIVEDGIIGYYSDTSKQVTVKFKKVAEAAAIQFNCITKEFKNLKINDRRWTTGNCINQEIAESLGYAESIFDAIFYKLSDCTSDDIAKMNTPTIPNNERNNTYSLDDDKDHRSYLEKLYDTNDLKPSAKLKQIAKKYIPFTFGIEIEVQNGWVPGRIKDKLGFRTCRDGSLDGGIEFVSIPLEGGKGLESIRLMCAELTKRTVLSNKCSVHFHFGDVRRDKLYVISLWQLLVKIQDEFRLMFPYSRTNSIREDGKVYASLLPDLNISTSKILNIKDEDVFKSTIVSEFTKIYRFLNNNKAPGDTFDEQFVRETRDKIIKGKIQKQYCFRVKKFNYTTKLPRHAVQGHKWEKKSRLKIAAL